MRKPYLIRTPEFEVTSGGIRVMWGLFGYLLYRGEVAFVNAQVKVPSIGIYPEIFHGNEMQATTVVRYLLNKPGVMGTGDAQGNLIPGPTKFDPNDRIYVFSKIYDTVGVPPSHVLFLPILNLHVFRDLHLPRKKTCYLIGKGVNKQKHPDDSVEITRQFATDQTRLAVLLNECHTFYCYDDMTAMTEIARLCGTRVMYYGGYSEAEWERYEPGTKGVGFYGKEKELRIGDFRKHYIELRETFEKNMDLFLEETQL